MNINQKHRIMQVSEKTLFIGVDIAKVDTCGSCSGLQGD